MLGQNFNISQETLKMLKMLKLQGKVGGPRALPQALLTFPLFQAYFDQTTHNTGEMLKSVSFLGGYIFNISFFTKQKRVHMAMRQAMWLIYIYIYIYPYPPKTEIDPRRPCVHCAAIRIARLAFVGVTFVPRGLRNGLRELTECAERYRLAIGDFDRLRYQAAQDSMPNMTGRPGHRTVEMNGGSSAPYLARTPCVSLFSTLFNRGGKRRAFRLPGAGGGSFPLYGGTFARLYSVSKDHNSLIIPHPEDVSALID